MVEFRLTTGMTAPEILAELRGRTSGESRQELVQVFYPPTDPAIPLPTHKILRANEEYALMLVRNSSRDQFGNITLTNVYIFLGVNDEGKYFAHPIEGYNREFNRFGNTVDFDAITDWMNRRTEGFAKRLQGDIMLRFASAAAIMSHDPHGTLLATTPSEVLKNRAHDTILRIPRNQWGTNDISFTLTPAPVWIGNHEVSTDGVLFMAQSQMGVGSDYVLVFGTQAVLQHPEHQIRTESIPAEHFAILAPQLGRRISVQGSRILGAD